MDKSYNLMLLRNTVANHRVFELKSLGRFASDIESLVMSMDDLSEKLRTDFSNLWGDIEIISYKCEEEGREINDKEKSDLEIMRLSFLQSINWEISQLN
ncbi:hypothetical protein MetexDRAFT_1709 [Methylorubrum extorquens DSM 13060]|jgi:hypothetical protein|uniref:Uncharacterized protein n=1 Tax=Methylorubrum extorquens DSM 13060 TaxID=882800 RepID=H1KGE7_METEX|nr:hypothetical protein MetexDRAFT_1709 [Methylorubrum extorquens DSM 13060]